MAFNLTNRRQEMVTGGYLREQGNFALTAGDTAGTVVAAAQAGFPFPGPIVNSDFTSNTSADILKTVNALPANQVRITSAANDTGTYSILYRAL